MRIIKKLPLPIAGLMLALGATGNLVASYGNLYKNIFGFISAIIFVLLVVKIFAYPKDVFEGLNNPVISSVSPTFSMGLMILSTYIKPMQPMFGYILWLIGIVLHIFLILYFTNKFILNFSIKKVFPSYFVVYVGIVVASVTAPAFNSTKIGQILFWFGFISYLILLPFVLYRVFKVKGIPEPAIPTITIFAAPASLCLAGYMSSFQEKNITLVFFLTGLSLIMFISVLIYMPNMLKLKFYPSYAAFTFPLVISAVALKKTSAFLATNNSGITFLNSIVKIEEVLAIAMVLYVLIRFSNFLFINKESKIDRESKIPQN